MPELKFVCYNILRSSRKEQIVANIKALAGQGVSLFALQEVRPPRRGAFIGDLILQELGAEWQAEYFLGAAYNSPDYGLGFVWRQPILQAQGFDLLSLPTLSKLGAYERYFERWFGDQSRPVQRGVLIGQFKFAGQLLRVSNVHADWHGGFGQRFRQLQHLANRLKTDPTAAAEIICGDFNTIGLARNGEQKRKIHALLGLEYTDLLPTFHRTTTHYQHLDHIFVRNLKKSDIAVHRLSGSDHYPILATVEL